MLFTCRIAREPAKPARRKRHHQQPREADTLALMATLQNVIHAEPRGRIGCLPQQTRRKLDVASCISTTHISTAARN